MSLILIINDHALGLNKGIVFKTIKFTHIHGVDPYDSVGITDGLGSQLLRKWCVIGVRATTLYNIMS